MSKSLDAIVKKLSVEKDSIWPIIIPLLIGSALTFLTGYLIERYKTRQNQIARSKELISKGRAKIYLISQILKDLAMYKVHKQYYGRATSLSLTSDAEEVHKKHYEKGQEQRVTKMKLDENIAEYFQIVTEYFISANKVVNFQIIFSPISNYIHPKSSKFSDCQTQDELVAELENEEKRLNQEYEKFLLLFENIQSQMEE